MFAMSSRVERVLMQYGVRPFAVAGCFVYVAFLWTLLLQQWIPYPFLFLFLGAVMGSAWFGGAVAGFLSVFLSTVFIEFFFLPPVYSFKVSAAAEPYFIAYIVCAVVVNWVSAAKRNTEREIREARDLLEVRVRERTAELEQSNRDLQERERQLRKLTEAIPQQIWSASPVGEVQYGNQHLLDYLGCAADDARGARFAEVFHPEDRELFQHAWEQACQSGQPLEGEWRILGGDGQYRWFLIRAIPERSRDGAILRWYGTHIDIEQRRRAEQALGQAQAELEHLLRVTSMAELTASIAHEVNQPLTALLMNAYACKGWLQASPANVEKALATAERMVEDGKRAGAVVARVRALFRHGEGLRETVDLNGVIRELAGLMREEAIRRNASLRLQLDSALPAVEADRVQMQQVLFNLVQNALDAVAEVNGRAREVVLSSAREGESEITVRVADSGSGLKAESAGRLFDAFFTTKPNGIGMGLSISRSILEAHDGQLRLFAQKPYGTVAQFTLPVKP